MPGGLLHFIDVETGEKVPCQVLVCVLPRSGYSYVQTMYSQKQEEFVNGLNNALFFFGGVPRNIKMDNLRSAVKKANRYDPEFTDHIIASQIPVAQWYDYINEPTVADAILDRIVPKAHRFELKGPSLKNKK